MTEESKQYNNTPAHSDDYYESIAGQEQLYLDEVEERLREVLISEGIARVPSMENVEEELDQAAEDLIIGDSDDPPLSEEAISENLHAASNLRHTNNAKY